MLPQIDKYLLFLLFLLPPVLGILLQCLILGRFRLKLHLSATPTIFVAMPIFALERPKPCRVFAVRRFLRVLPLPFIQGYPTLHFSRVLFSHFFDFLLSPVKAAVPFLLPSVSFIFFRLDDFLTFLPVSLSVQFSAFVSIILAENILGAHGCSVLVSLHIIQLTILGI